MMKNSEKKREREVQENCRGEITPGYKPPKKIALRKNVPQENCPAENPKIFSSKVDSSAYTLPQ